MRLGGHREVQHPSFKQEDESNTPGQWPRKARGALGRSTSPHGRCAGPIACYVRKIDPHSVQPELLGFC